MMGAVETHMTYTSSVWGRSERRRGGPFPINPLARLSRRVALALPWNSGAGRDLESGSGLGREPSQKARLYNFGPEGPTRRQREEVQRREEIARRLDRVRLLAQALLMGLAAVLMFLWAQWMR